MMARNRNGQIKTFVAGSTAFVPTTRTGINGAVLYAKTNACVDLGGRRIIKKVGELCIGDRGPTVTTHSGRRMASRSLIPRADNVFVFKAPLKVI
jgi:hypothetical protein